MDREIDGEGTVGDWGPVKLMGTSMQDRVNVREREGVIWGLAIET